MLPDSTNKMKIQFYTDQLQVGLASVFPYDHLEDCSTEATMDLDEKFHINDSSIGCHSNIQS
jgi:hypothetical protein